MNDVNVYNQYSRCPPVPPMVLLPEQEEGSVHPRLTVGFIQCMSAGGCGFSEGTYDSRTRV